MTLKTLDDLKKIFKSTKNHYDIVDILDSDSELFELHAYIYRKASSLNPVYHSRDLNQIPAVIRKQLNLDIITTGANAEGMDFLEIGPDRSIAFESKRYESQNKHKGVSHGAVANKNAVIQNTKIDQLIFVTNKTKASFRAEKFNPTVGYIYREEIFSYDAIKVVRNYLKNQQPKKYNILTPRDAYFVKAIDDCGLQIIGIHQNIKGRIKIFQHWPASTGKGSMPRLVYDKFIESLWNFKKAFPINVIVNPNLAVLKTNLLKQVEHDLGLKNNVRHITFNNLTAGVNMEELQSLKHICDVAKTDKQFYDLIKKYKNSTVFIHVCNDSYEKMGRLLTEMKKSIFFSHIDEVHHNIQPINSSWRAPLDDKIVKVRFAYMTSANIRVARGKGVVESMDDTDFCDIKVLELDEKDAVKLGYKRQTRQLIYEYDLNQYPHNWQIELSEGNYPIVKIGKSVVPLIWAEQLDANIRAYIEHGIDFMKYTFNEVDNIKDFAKIYQSLKEDILRSLARSGVISSNTKRYRDILKRPFIVADTHSFATTKILREVDSIPEVYPDGCDFGHCFLLGEGWDPKNGWVQANCFMDPTHSALRIYQDVNRGARGPQHRKYNDLVIAQHKEFDEDEISYRNRSFKSVVETGEKLQHGFEDIRDSVIFKAVRKSSTPGSGTAKGQDFETFYDEVSADMLTSAFSNYVAFGRNFRLFESTNTVIDYYQTQYEKLNLCFGVSKRNELISLEMEILEKFPEIFDDNTHAKPYRGGRTSRNLTPEQNEKLRRLRKIVSGAYYGVAPQRKIQIFEWREQQEKLAEEQKAIIRKIVERHVSKQFHPNTNYATHTDEVLNLSFVDKTIFEGPKKKDSWDLIALAFGKGKFGMPDLWEKYKDRYPKTKRKVAQTIIKFVKQKIKEADYSRNLLQLNGFELTNQKQGSYSLKSESELQKYIKQEINMDLSVSTIRMICVNQTQKKFLFFNIFTEQEETIVSKFELKCKELKKGSGYGLLQPGEIIVTPAGEYTDILKALKDNKVEMYSDSVLRLGRYLSKMINSKEWKIKKETV